MLQVAPILLFFMTEFRDFFRQDKGDFSGLFFILFQFTDETGKTQSARRSNPPERAGRKGTALNPEE